MDPLVDRDAASLRFLEGADHDLRGYIATAALALDDEQLAVPPVHAGESFRRHQFPDDLTVMCPTVGVLGLASRPTLAGNPVLQHPFVEAYIESVHGPP